MRLPRRVSISQSPVLLFLVIHPWQHTVRKLTAQYDKHRPPLGHEVEHPTASCNALVGRVLNKDVSSTPEWLPISIEVECSIWAMETIKAIEIVLESSNRKRPRRASSFPCTILSDSLSDEAFGKKLEVARRRIEQKLESRGYSSSRNSSSADHKR